MRRIIAVLLAGGLLLAACAGGASGAGDVEMAADLAQGGEGGEAVVQPTTSDAGAVKVDFEVADGRDIIRRASLELHASDTRETFDEIVELVESIGGFVAQAQVFPTSGEDDQPMISMTLRVPADTLNDTMTAIKDGADEVVAESQSAEDVTKQFIDLDARLTNLEALETELRALLTEVRKQNNADPEKILSVFDELASVRGQIEQIQGQLNYLKDATALATLDVQITQTPSAIPIVDEPWRPSVVARDSVRDLLTGFQGVADWAINFAIYVLPMLLITLGPLTVAGVLVYRRWFRRETVVPTAAGS